MTRAEQENEKAAQQAESEWLKNQRLSCKLCDGVGFQTRFYLVTYAGKSWGTIRSKERIFRGEYASEYEASVELRKKLHNTTINQQVMSAATDCSCRKSFTNTEAGS